MGIIILMETHCENCKSKIETHHHGHHVKALGIINSTIDENEVNYFNNDSLSTIHFTDTQEEVALLDAENDKYTKFGEPSCGDKTPKFVRRLCLICKQNKQQSTFKN